MILLFPRYVVATILAVVLPVLAWAAPSDWPAYQLDPSHTGDNASSRVRLPLQPAWTVPLSAGGWGFSSAILAGDTVYASGLDGSVAALDRLTGRKLWTFTADGAVQLVPAVDSGLVVMGSAEGRMSALGASDGVPVWSLDVGNAVFTSPAVSSGAVYLAANDSTVYAVSLSSGSILWTRRLDGYVTAAPAADAQRVYVATLAGHLVALSRQDGSVVWDDAESAGFRSAPSVSPAAVYAASEDGHLRAYDPATGTRKWDAALGAAPAQGLALAQGKVFVTTRGGGLLALDATIGAVLWNAALNANAYAAPVLMGSALFAADEGGRVYALTPSSGGVLSAFDLGARVAAPPAAGIGGFFALTDDGVLHAYRSPNQPPGSPTALLVDGRAAPVINDPRPVLSWTPTDPDPDDAESAFELQVASVADFSSLEADSGLVQSATSQYQPSVALGAGGHYWRVRTVDSFGAAGPYAAAGAFIIDVTPPAVVLISPATGAQFLAFKSTITVAFSVSDDIDTAPFVTAVLEETVDKGSPRGVLPSTVSVVNGQKIDPLSLDDGLWILAVTARDAAGNVTQVSTGPFEVLHDVLPPRTTLALGAPRSLAGGPFVTRATQFTLSSVDDLVSTGDAIGLGVARQSLSVDGSARATFIDSAPAPGAASVNTFTLLTDSDGWHTVAFHATDVLGNDETLKISSVVVDGTAPQTTLLAVGGHQFPASSSTSFYASSATMFGLPAVDPIVGNAASGLAFTRWQDNGGPFQNFSAPFGLAEGVHALGYQSQDNVQNLEVLRSTTVLIDATPPQTTLTLVGGHQFPSPGGSTFYASSDTRLALPAIDPVVNGVASGLAFTRWQDNGGVFQPFSSAFYLSEGGHALGYQSQDNVANLEVLRSTNVWIDGTPPVTTFAFGTPYYKAADGTNYITPATPLRFTAADPGLPTGQAGSGVNHIEVAIDSGAFRIYTASLTFAEGRHAIQYRSIDNVANVETTRTLYVQSDATPPQTSLAVAGGYQFQGPSSASFYASSATTFGFPAADSAVNNVASGLAFTRWQDNGGTFQTSGSSFSLSEGVHALGYQSQDNVQNLEVLRSTTILIDATAPRTTLAIVGGRQFASLDGQTFYASSDTLLALPASDPVVNGVASGLAFTRWQDNGGAFRAFASTFALSEGAHSLGYQSQDNVANLEVLRSTNAWVDATPPVTTFAFGTPYYKAADGTNYVTPATPLSFAATDPALPTGQPGSGVNHIEVAIDGGAFVTYTSSLTFAEGRHVIQYRSLDNVANIEATRTLNVQSDATPPQTTLALLGGRQFRGPDGASFFASTDTRYGLPAVDPMSNGVASGLAFTHWKDNGGAFQTFSAAFGLSEGMHALGYQSQDNVLNLEVLESTRALVDGTAPQTTLTVVGGHQYPGSDASTFYASSDTRLALPAADPVVSAVASGLAFTRWQDNGGAFQSYSAPFGLAEGVHALGYQSQDNVQNLEILRSTTVLIDATPPQTTLAIVGGHQFPGPGGSTFYASSDTRLTLPAVDPVTNGVASGLAFTRWQDNGGAFQAYSTAFSLSEGAHALAYQSQDNVANLEVAHTTNAWIDATPPVTTFAFGTPYFKAADGTNYVTPVTPVSFAASDPALPTGQAGSGVNHIEVAIDGGQFVTYTSSLTFAEGRHTILYRSFDNVADVEATKTLYVQSDATPPQTTLAVLGGHQFPAGAASFYASSATLVGLPAVDPVVGNVASGLAFTRWQDNGGVFQSFSAPFGLAEGVHALGYQSQDNVQNLEILRSTTVLIDATAPQTTLAAVGGHQFAGPNGSTFYASSDTRLALPAVDPMASAVASGLAFTRWQDNGGAFQTYSTAFGLAEGAHVLGYQSQDKVANLEVLRSTNAWIDATPPVTTFTIGTPYYKASDGTNYITPATPVTFAATDPALPTGQPGSGVNRIEVAVDGGAFAIYTSSLTFAEGRHSIHYRSIDDVANFEATRTLFVQSDATPPQTTLAVSGGHQYAGPDAQTFYASSDTRLALPAVDPVSNGVASGLAFTRWQDNGGASQMYGAAFGLAEGAHTLGYQSQDNVTNLEVLRSTNAWIDATPPVTTFAFGTPYYKAADGTNYVTPATPLSFAATDPVLPTGQPGSGVNHIEVAIDGGAFTTYTTALKFAEGRHTVQYRSFDNVANVEVTRTLALQSDATPPQTTLVVLGGHQFPAGAAGFYASSATLLGLPAADPVVNNVASGLAFTRWQDNGGAFQSFSAPFGLPEGVHALGYQSQDNVQNLEVLRSTTILIDATAPQTTLAVLGGHQYPGPDGATFYASSDTRLTLPAVDPVANGVASGLAFTRWQDSGGAFQTYSAAFGLAEGSHAVTYQSQDNVANLEVAHATNAWIDATPPVTTFTFGTPYFKVADGTNYITPATPVRFAASDPALPTGQAGSGVNHIEVAIDGGQFVTYTSSLTFTEGRHSIQYRSVDNVANVEMTKTLYVQSDATPPQTTLAVLGGHQYPAGPASFYASSATMLGLPAADPVVNNVASGLTFTRWQDNGGAFQNFSAPFGLAEGAHALGYQSQDNVQNLEVLRSTTILIDATAPQTTLAVVGGHQFPGPDGATFYASSDTRLALPAIDPVTNGVASGLAFTRWQDNAGAFQAYNSAFGLAEGAHALGYQSQDNVANLEVLRSTNAWIDATPPVTTFAIGTPYYKASDGTNYITPTTPLTFSAVDPLLPTSQPGSGVNRIEVAVDGGAFTIFTSSLTFAEGRHAIQYRSFDNVANVEATRTLYVQSDATPPQTTLAVSGGHQYAGPDGQTFYASSDTRLALPAVDPVSNGVASGLAFTRWQDNGGAFQTYSTAFGLAEGAHTLGYQSQDNVTNLEVLRSTNAWVDATPPATTFAFGTPYYKAADGTNYVTPATPLSFAATDPALPTGQPGSGVNHIEVAIDGGAFTTYTTALKFAEGRHTVQYRSFDNVANVEVTRTLALQSDATPPQTTLAVLGGHQFPAGATSFYASSATMLGLPAADPVVNNVASGLAFTRWQDNGGAFQRFSAPFSLVEGVHALGYQSQDNVQNLEVLRSTTILIDATAPQTTLAVVGGHQFPGPDGATFYASSDTRLALPAIDPVTNGVASGLAFTRWQDDGGAFQTYSTAFGLAEGAHTLGYQSQDNAQNLEVLRSTNAWIDATPPVTTFTFGTPYYKASDGTNYITPATPVTFSSADPALPTGQPGSGVNHIEVAIDGGQFVTYTSSLTFAEGRHTILYRSFDNVANVEATRTLYVQSDATPPQTTLAVLGGHQFHGPDGASFFASVDTRYALPTADPVVKNVASGVAFTRWQDNGGAFQTFTVAFALAEGVHRLGYQSQDNVLNLEVLESTTALVDATAPQTTLTVMGGRQFPGPDAQTFYASSATLLALPAADPVVSGVASGLAFTRLQDNGAAFQTYSAAFGLAEGAHALGYQSQDNVQNLEVLRATNAWIDATPPVTTFMFGTPYYQAPDGTNYVTPVTAVTFSAADPALPSGQPGSGVNRIEVAVDGGAFVTYTSALKFAEGRHTILYRSFDNVANVEPTKTLQVQSDATPPQTTLAVLGGHQFAGPDASTFYASLDTRLALPAIDPVVNGVASRLAFTRWQDNGGAFQNFSTPFGLAEGAHAVSYQSQDHVANLEAPRSTSVWVDATPPITTFAFGTPYFKAADGTNYITPATPLSFTAADPALPTGQPGSDVNRIEVSIDSGPFTVYASSLTFAEGRHAILYRAFDNVANIETTRALYVQSDATPPLTTLSIAGGHQFPGPDAASFFASLDTRYALPAADPVVNGVASGVAFTRWQDNAGPFVTFSVPFVLAEGIHHLGYQSQDNVQNLEVPRSTAALVDATPPRTTLAFVGGHQYPGPDAATFYASSDTRLALPAVDPVVNNVASGLAFTRWQDNGGAFQTYGAPFGLAEGAHPVSYQSQDNVQNLEVLRATNAWIDVTPPVTTFTFGMPYYKAADGTNYVTPATTLSFAATDPVLPTGQAGSGVNHVEVAIDGGAFTTYTAPLKFGEGRHTVLYRSIDNVANVEASRTLAVQSDNTPPVSSLVIGQPQAQLQSVLLVSSRTPFGIAAVDPVVQNVASGVRGTSYRVADVAPSTAPFTTFNASFTMSGLDVNKVIEFYSRDNVLNTEVVRSSTVLLDSTPPELSLLSPAACDAGLCHVLKGRFPVLGTARDLHLRDYQLEYAPGKDAATGFVRVGSGTVSVTSGTLAVWDASALSGWQTLRLTGTDLVLNISVLAIDVWVGDPAALMALGNHDTFNLPSAVAVSSSGAIYVADRDKDRVAVFSASGALLAAYGVSAPKGPTNASTSTLTLNKPQGVAVDAAGNIYVADTNDDSVLKLGPDGRVLLTLGRLLTEGNGTVKTQPGNGPGEFNKPIGVAVDGKGLIYAADSENNRVEVFSAQGAFMRQVTLPPVGKGSGGTAGPAGKPAGIALDAAGNLYVADPDGQRALEFDPSGNLVLTIPIYNLADGSPGQPEGVAVSPSGQCILVADQKDGNILKFDRQGAQNLAFGMHGGNAANDPKATFLTFNKPTGLAFDSAGDLYVADRNDDRVLVLGLPSGNATVVVPPSTVNEQVARGVIDHDAGGTVARKDGTAVFIPGQALPDDLQVTVSSQTNPVEAQVRLEEGTKKGFVAASAPVDFGPEGTQFAKPVTLVIPYDATLASAAQDLRISYWNAVKQDWEPLTSQVNPANMTVTATTMHFSLYQVMAPAAKANVAAGPTADATFTLRDLYVFPNPAVRGARPTVHVAVGVADRVTIRIYDISGRQVEQATFDSTPAIIDDGSGPKYAYEYPWNGHIPSGVYLYTVVAEKGGYPPIRRSGKFAVVR